MAEVKGRVLYPPKVLNKNKSQVDWLQYTKGQVSHSDPVKLKNERWTFVYSERDYNMVEDIKKNMKNASQRLDMEVDEPMYIEVPDNMARKPKGQGYLEAMKEDLDKKSIIVVVLISDTKAKKFMKKWLDQFGVPSQFLVVNTMKRILGKMGVFSNLLKQINSKVRKDIYRIAYPSNIRNSMIVGVDAVNKGGDCILSMTATYTQF